MYDEAFEITRTFHKDLEDLFNALVIENGVRLFYERRSKQYTNNLTIKPYEKINLRGIIQSFVSVFLNEPYKGHRHESKLLQEYKNKIFIDSQSKYPYYVASLILSKMDREYRIGTIPKDLLPYKMHLCWIIKELLEPNSPTINNEKEIDQYCKNIQKKILDSKIWNDKVQESYKRFLSIQELWISEKGIAYKYGIKDSTDFFAFLQSRIHTQTIPFITRDNPLLCRGTVIKVILGRHGRHYGFISKMPNDIFFHEMDNPGLDFSKLYAKDVLYATDRDKITGKEKAVHMQLI